MQERCHEMPTARREIPFDAEQLRAIQDQTDALLRSELWRQAPRQQRLLRHIVQATVAGDDRQLSGQALGRLVFDRGPDFDPAIDPIVRVEAGRLRSKLLAHYAGEGARDPVHIEVPKGGYVARFAFRTPALAPARQPLADGIGRFWSQSAESLQRAQQAFADAVAHDPGYAAAHVWLAVAATNRHAFALDRTEGAIRLARQHAARAIALEPGMALGHAAQCAVLTWCGQTDQAIAAGEHAVALDPNLADGHALLALARAQAMKLPAALAGIDLALRLNPAPTGYYHWIKGSTLQLMGRDEEAREVYAASVAKSSFDQFNRVGLALCLLRAGDEVAAQRQMTHFRAWFPHPDLVFRNRFTDPELRSRHAAAMQRLGFTELPA
jgi:tetratricopeptide (TPR) repeat protein